MEQEVKKQYLKYTNKKDKSEFIVVVGSIQHNALKDDPGFNEEETEYNEGKEEKKKGK